MNTLKNVVSLSVLISHGKCVRVYYRCHNTGLLASACGDDTIRIFREVPTPSDPNQPSVELLETVSSAHAEDVNCVSWSPKVEGLLASCSDDGSVNLWMVENTWEYPYMKIIYGHLTTGPWLRGKTFFKANTVLCANYENVSQGIWYNIIHMWWVNSERYMWKYLVQKLYVWSEKRCIVWWMNLK